MTHRKILLFALGLSIACTKAEAPKECKIGDEGCECYPNKTCNGKALECLSNLCVDPNAEGSSPGSGKGGGGSTDSDSGTGAAPGSSTPGGKEPTGGSQQGGSTPGNTSGMTTTPGNTTGSNPGTGSTGVTPGSTATPSNVPTPVSVHGQLSVSGRQMVNSKGTAVQLKGMSTMWLNWDDAGYSQSLEGLRFMRDNWNLQLLRVAMGVDADGAYLTNPDKMKQMLYKAVDNAIELGVYVIIDWHDHDAHLHVDQAKAFFAEVSAKYKGVPNVMYETFNEPVKDISWSTVVKPYHEAVIPEIRKNDSKAIIILGSPHWSQDVDVAAADPVSGSNLMYTVHFYSCSHGSVQRGKAQQAYAQNLPLFVTEWGASDADGGYDLVVCESEAKSWLNWLEQSKISWAAWKLDSCTTTKCDTTAFFKSRSVSPNGGWTDADLNGHAPFVVSQMKLGAPTTTPMTTTTPMPTTAPASTTPPVSSCTPSGSCAAGNGKDCKDGVLVTRDCSPCAILSCGTECCGGIGVLGATTYPDFVEKPSLVKTFTASASGAALGLQFTGESQMGAITFALDKAYSIDPAYLLMDATWTGTAYGSIMVSLENGADGCLYSTSLSAGVRSLFAENSCWGGWLEGGSIRSVKQINVRFDADYSGTCSLQISSITL